MGFAILPNSTILALYHLEDLNDSSGNSHTLSNYNSVAFGTGKIGNCAQLGSSNSNKYLGHADGLGEDLSGEASASIWAMIQTAPTSGETQDIFFWSSTTGTARSIILAYINESGTLKLNLIAGGTNNKYTMTLSTNVWYKFDVNISATPELYINGVLVMTGTRGTTAAGVNCLNLGYGNSGFPTKGNLDEAVFFSTTRTAAAIRRRYAFEKGMLV